jgi:predicted metal-dependent RNase
MKINTALYNYEEIDDFVTFYEEKKYEALTDRKKIFLRKNPTAESVFKTSAFQLELKTLFARYTYQKHHFIAEENMLYIQVEEIGSFFNSQEGETILKKLRQKYFINTKLFKSIKEAVRFDLCLSIIQKNQKIRKEILELLQKKANNVFTFTPEWTFEFLGGRQEVGRNCIYFQNGDISFLIDRGLGFSENKAYPHLETLGSEGIQKLDFVILTHAHLDHCGTLPILIQYGFKGPFFMTAPTRDLFYLQAKEILKLNTNYLFSEKDIYQVLAYTFCFTYGQNFSPFPQFSLSFFNSTHILGSARVFLKDIINNKTLYLSSDFRDDKKSLFGRLHKPQEKIDIILTECTNGAKISKTSSISDEKEKRLGSILQNLEWKQTTQILIPVFGLGRAQEVLCELITNLPPEFLKEKGIRIFVEGSIKQYSRLHISYSQFLRKDIKAKIFFSKDSFFFNSMFEYTKAEGYAGPQIIIATAGMMVGGPIVQYFKQNIYNSERMVIFTGYQRKNSLGAAVFNYDIPTILRSLKLEKPEFKYKVMKLDKLSGHASLRELLKFQVRMVQKNPACQIYYFHGDRKALEHLKHKTKKHVLSKNIVFRENKVKYFF